MIEITSEAAPKRKVSRLESAVEPQKAKRGKLAGEKITTTPEQLISGSENAGGEKIITSGERSVSSSENAGGEKITTPAGKVIVYVPPSDLIIHPDLSGMPAPSETEDAELEASIDASGIHHPLIVNSPKRQEVLDGARRLCKALKLKLPTVPVIYDDRADALAVAISTALTRRHLCKGQRALYLFKLHRDLRKAWTENVPDMGLRSETGGKPDAEEQDTHYEHISFRKLGEQYGLCYTLFVRLNKMWNNSTEEEWAEIVRSIESGESSLDAQYAGFVGRMPSKGVVRSEEKLSNHSIRMRRGIVAFGQEAKHWKHFGTKKRGELTQKIDDAFEKLDLDLLLEVIRIAVAKRTEKEANCP